MLVPVQVRPSAPILFVIFTNSEKKKAEFQALELMRHSVS